MKNILPALGYRAKQIKESPTQLNKLIDKYHENPLAVIKDIKKEII